MAEKIEQAAREVMSSHPPVDDRRPGGAMKGTRKVVAAISWPACAARCDHCGKRRLTYQLRDHECNDRMCAECLLQRAASDDVSPPSAPQGTEPAPREPLIDRWDGALRRMADGATNGAAPADETPGADVDANDLCEPTSPAAIRALTSMPRAESLDHLLEPVDETESGEPCPTCLGLKGHISGQGEDRRVVACLRCGGTGRKEGSHV